MRILRLFEKKIDEMLKKISIFKVISLSFNPKEISTRFLRTSRRDSEKNFGEISKEIPLRFPGKSW